MCGRSKVMVVKHAYFTHLFRSTLLLNELSHVTQYLIKGSRVIGKYNCPYWKLIGHSYSKLQSQVQNPVDHRLFMLHMHSESKLATLYMMRGPAIMLILASYICIQLLAHKLGNLLNLAFT